MKRRKIGPSGLAALIGALALSGILSGCSGGAAPINPGLIAQRLAPCPDTPNCVSSQASEASQRVEALRYSGDAAAAQNQLLIALKGMDRVRIRHADANYIHAEFRSALFGFVDDVTLLFAVPGMIEVRSASRVGYADFGVNRQRVEAIRSRFAAPASVET